LWNVTEYNDCLLLVKGKLNKDSLSHILDKEIVIVFVAAYPEMLQLGVEVCNRNKEWIK